MPESFSWLADQSCSIINEILTSSIQQWPDGPHPFQVEACAYVLAKTPTILLASTASGKTATFFCPLLVLQHLSLNPRPEIPVEFSRKPVVLVVTPLMELGNSHALEMKEFGLKAVSVNAATLQEARAVGRDLFLEIRRCEWPIVFLSAERLTSKEVDVILRDPTFRDNIVMLGIDEAHVLIPWSQSFRKAYKQISLLRRRLPDSCALAVVTATLTKEGLEGLCRELDLRPGGYHCIRRSVQRPNIRTVISKLTHNLSSASFPNISWLFHERLKAVIFCGSLDLVWRVGLFGWSHYTVETQFEHVRVWSSLSSREYNTRTLELFADDSRSTVIVATIAFGMGMNLRNIQYSINLGLPETIEALVQQNGRAGRNLSTVAFGITYVPASVITSLQDEIRTYGDIDDPSNIHKKLSQFNKVTLLQRSKSPAPTLDPNLRSLILAHQLRLCLESVKNQILGVPGIDPAVTCAELGRIHCCGSCDSTGMPFISAMPTSIPTAATTTTSFPSPLTPTSLPPSLPKKIITNLNTWLDAFAEERWNSKTTPEAMFAPAACFWRGIRVSLIAERLPYFSTFDCMRVTLKDWIYLEDDGEYLFRLLTKLIAAYIKSIEQVKEIKAFKAAVTKARAKAAKAAKAAVTSMIPPLLPLTPIVTQHERSNLVIRLPARPFSSRPLPAAAPLGDCGLPAKVFVDRPQKRPTVVDENTPPGPQSKRIRFSSPSTEIIRARALGEHVLHR